MERRLSRQEPTQRYGVAPDFSGRALRCSSGATCDFRGVDVSQHGLGCVIVGDVQIRESLIIEFGGQKHRFEVMWVESYLGIENTYRVGLQCLDHLLDVRGRLSGLGLVTALVDEGYAA